jgi:hypothetical protein
VNQLWAVTVWVGSHVGRQCHVSACCSHCGHGRVQVTDTRPPTRSCSRSRQRSTAALSTHMHNAHALSTHMHNAHALSTHMHTFTCSVHTHAQCTCSLHTHAQCTCSLHTHAHIHMLCPHTCTHSHALSTHMHNAHALSTHMHNAHALSTHMHTFTCSLHTHAHIHMLCPHTCTCS